MAEFLSPKDLDDIKIDKSILSNAGDILIRNSTSISALPVGTEGQVLKVGSGLPSWQNESTGGSDVLSLLTTNGDILYRDGSGVLAPIHPGTQGQVLTIGLTGLPAFSDPITGNPTAPTMIRGVGTFNSTTGVTIALGATLANANYSVFIQPNQDPQGYLGEVWVESLTTTNFVVKNSGSGNTTTFIWTVLY